MEITDETLKVLKQLGLKFSSKKMSPATSTYQFRCLPYLNKFAVKISAQPHTTLCIQFLDRENNDKKIHFH